MKPSPWSLADKIVLLPGPLGASGREQEDQVRVAIQQLGGDIAYAHPPIAPWQHHGPSKDLATHEYVAKGAVGNTPLPKLTQDELFGLVAKAHEELRDLMSTYERPCYIPQVRMAKTDANKSRYFGKPWLPEGQPWPEYEGRPMRFVLQLRTIDLPGDWPKKLDSGLLVFFHGEGSRSDQQNFIKLVDPTSKGRVRDLPSGLTENPPLEIVEWTEMKDYPWQETYSKIPDFKKFDRVALGFGSSLVGHGKGLDGKLYSEKEVIERGIAVFPRTFECDKLGGWPRWEQGDDTPLDQEGTPMEFLMQVGFEGLFLDQIEDRQMGTSRESQSNLEGKMNIDWPTWGRGQIFYSPQTKEFKYVWACD